HHDGHQTVAYIDVLKSHIDLLERELAEWKAEARRKDHLLAAALERIPAIEAPQGPRDAPQTDAEPPGGGTPEERTEPQGGARETEGAARRPWWLGWLGG
ncbi:MAG: hypothetical protein M3R38_34405, partial [Actinomycetota bacterium]|nr:hypothetical protein [Actinomycetota bacterium]